MMNKLKEKMANVFLKYLLDFVMKSINSSKNVLSKSYNPGQNICHKVKKCSKRHQKFGQDIKNLLSNFVCFWTAIVKVQFLEERLGTRLRILDLEDPAELH